MPFLFQFFSKIYRVLDTNIKELGRMLSKLFKKRKLEIFAPINGEVVALNEVPDPVFSEKMMGESYLMECNRV